jgi:hypothetical protein
VSSSDPRIAAGTAALGAGSFLVGGSLAVYCLVGLLAAGASGACVGASTPICAAGPLGLTPIGGVVCALALVVCCIGATSALAGVATLREPRTGPLAALTLAALAVVALGAGLAVYGGGLWASIPASGLGAVEDESFPTCVSLFLVAAPPIVLGALTTLYTVPRWWLLARR